MECEQWTLSHEFKFDAAHCLDRLPAGHKCTQLHGHTWKVKVNLIASALDEYSMVVDFHVFKAACREHIHKWLDHNLINKVVEVPTCEVLSKWMFETLSEFMRLPASGMSGASIQSVTVWENDNNSCTYEQYRIE